MPDLPVQPRRGCAGWVQRRGCAGWVQRRGCAGWVQRTALLLALTTTPSRGPRVPEARADELSSADKLRLVYSTQISWTRDRLPIVPVRIAEGRSELQLAGAKLRVLPDGEGGSEVRLGEALTVRVVDGKAARTRLLVVAGRFGTQDPARAELVDELRKRGLQPRTTEVGAMLGVEGRVFDGRQLLVVTASVETRAEAEAALAALIEAGVEGSIEQERVERPRGRIVATDRSGAQVSNEGILWFVADGPIEVGEIDRESGGRERRRYAGTLYATLDAEGRLALVNAAPENRLLGGLVPSEMPPTAPLEALKAQAIAARTTLLARLGSRHPGEPYRLCSTQHCQVYAGIDAERPRTNEAIQATRGQLLLRPDGRLVDTVYSAWCGGHGEDNDRAFQSPRIRPVADPQLRGRPDVLAADEAGAGSPLTALAEGRPLPRSVCARRSATGDTERWSESVDLEALGARLRLGAVRALEVTERGASGRAVRLVVTGERGVHEVRGELGVRRTLGAPGRPLRSALFTLELRRDGEGRPTTVLLRGVGHGHGVGLCQQGAMQRAEAGATAQQILEHYFRGARLTTVY